MSSCKKSVPRVASFPGAGAVAKSTKKLGSSPNKVVNKLHKSLPRDYRGMVIELPRNSLSSPPPGVTYKLGTDDPSRSSPSQSQTLSGLGSTPPGSSKLPRKSKLLFRSARGQCLAALQKRSTSSKALETTSHVEENTTVSKGSEETTDVWSWELCHKKPIAKSSLCRTYFRCAVKGCPAKKMVKSSNKGHPSFMKPVYIGSHTCGATSVKNPERDIISPASAKVVTLSTETTTTTQPFRFTAQAAQEDKNPKRRNPKVYRIPSLQRKSDPSGFDRSNLEGLSDLDNPPEVAAGKADEEPDTDMVGDDSAPSPGIDTQEWSEHMELNNATSTYENNIPGSQFTEEWLFSQDTSVRDDNYVRTNQKFEEFKLSSPYGGDGCQKGPVSGVSSFSFNELLFARQAARDAAQDAGDAVDEEEQEGEEVVVGGDRDFVRDSTARGVSDSGANVRFGNNLSTRDLVRMDEDDQVGANVGFGNNPSAREPTRTDEDDQADRDSVARKQLERLRILQASSRDVVVVAGQVVGLRGCCEFYFLDAKSMSQVVGVGLPYSKTLVQNGSAAGAGVEVFECGEPEWAKAWTNALGAEESSSSFTILTMRLSGSSEKSKKKPSGPVSMAGMEMAEKFGVGVNGANMIVQFFKEAAAAAVAERNSHFPTEPVLSVVVKYLLLSKTRFVTKDVDDKGSSFLKMGGSCLDEEEVLMDESGDVRMKESLLLQPRVTVRPSHEGTISPGALLPESSSSLGAAAPTIISSLTMDFAKFDDGLNRIAVEISVNCALEDPQRQMETRSTGTGMLSHLRERHDWWYHDNINVSLKCAELDDAFLMDPYGLLETGNDVEASFGDTLNCRTTSLDEAMTGNKMSAGFFARDLSSMGEARLAYEFSKFSDDNDDDDVGVGVPLRAITRGTWELATEEENVPYLFNMERQLIRKSLSQDLNHLTNRTTSQEEEEVYQDYKVLLYVNHAMTHLHRVGNLNKITVGTVGTINDLMR